MTDYNKYVIAINKIYEIINQIKQKTSDQDNLNKIASIEEYKQVVVNNAPKFSNQQESSSSSIQKLDSLEVNDDR